MLVKFNSVSVGLASSLYLTQNVHREEHADVGTGLTVAPMLKASFNKQVLAPFTATAALVRKAQLVVLFTWRGFKEILALIRTKCTDRDGDRSADCERA